MVNPSRHGEVVMHNHPHPGEVLKEMVMAPLGLSVTEASSRFSISRADMLSVLNGKAGISSDLAEQLGLAGAGTARAWLALQANYDLWASQQDRK